MKLDPGQTIKLLSHRWHIDSTTLTRATIRPVNGSDSQAVTISRETLREMCGAKEPKK